MLRSVCQPSYHVWYALHHKKSNIITSDWHFKIV